MAEMSGGKVQPSRSISNGSLPTGSIPSTSLRGQGQKVPNVHLSGRTSSSSISTVFEYPSSPSTITALPDSPNERNVTLSSFGVTKHCGKIVGGVVLMVVSGTCWVAITQLVKSTYQWPTFHSPFFVMYFSTFWILVTYPAFLTGHFVSSKGKISIKETFRECILIFGSGTEQGFKSLKVLAKVTGFSLLWTLAVYLYMRALNFKTCMDVAIIFATNSSFDYLMSWIILQKKFMAIKIVALLLSMAGICMVTYMDERGYAGPGMWGSVMATAATTSAAFFKVLFTRVLGKATSGQTSMFLTCLSVFHLLSMWPLLLALYFTNAEPISWNHVPWDLLCGIGALGLVFTMMSYLGNMVAYSSIMRYNLILAIPLCAMADVLWRGETFGGTEIGSSVLIGLASLCNTLPEDWHDNFLKMIRWKQNDRERQRAEAVMSPRQRLRSTTTVC